MNVLARLGLRRDPAPRKLPVSKDVELKNDIEMRHREAEARLLMLEAEADVRLRRRGSEPEEH